MDKVLRQMNLAFFGTGTHKMSAEQFMAAPDAVFLDVRSKEEAESLSFSFAHHPNIQVLQIPVDELPDRLHDVSMDRLIGIFCPAQVRSTMAYMYLLVQGWPTNRVRILEGGYGALTEALKPGKVWKVVKP